MLTSERSLTGPRRLTQLFGAATAIGGTAVAVGWGTHVDVLRSLVPSATPVRVSAAVGAGLLGFGLLAGGSRGKRVRFALSCLAAATGASSALSGVAGRDTPWLSGLATLGLSTALAVDARWPHRVRLISSAAAAASALVAYSLVEHLGLPLDAAPGATTMSPGGILLFTLAAAGVQTMIAGRAGAVHALWTQGSVRSALLRGFVLPIPLIAIGPLTLVVVALRTIAKDEDAAIFVARVGASTIFVLSIAAAMVGNRIANRLTAWLDDLTSAAAAVAAGDLEREIRTEGPVEIARLGSHFRAMQSSLRRRAMVDTLVRDAAREIVTAPHLNAAVRTLGETASKFCRVERVSFSIPEHDGAFRLSAVWGPQSQRLPVGQIVPLSPDVRDELAAGRSALSADTVTADEASVDHLLFQRGIRSWVAVPVLFAGSLRAIVAFSFVEPNAFAPEDVPLLETLVRETGGALNTLDLLERERDATKRLRELDAMRQEFVEMVAHDLRSPLTVVGGFTEMLRDQWEHLTDVQRLEYLQAILRNVTTLTELVEDVLEVARLDAAQLRLDTHPFDVPTLVARIVSDTAAVDPDRLVEIKAPASVRPALGDEERIGQVLNNLLSNAFKFSPTSEPVEICIAERDSMIEVAVADGGVGISADDLPKLFQRFSRITRPGRPTVRGTGLGLFISRTLVEAQGGTIRAESTPGQGSTFTFALPVARD